MTNLEITSAYVGSDQIIKLYLGAETIWSSSTPPVPPTPVYSAMPLTFEIISGGTIVWRAQNTAYTKTIEYSTDSGETWTSITSNTGDSAPSISVSAGDVVQFRGDNATYSSGSTTGSPLKSNYFSGSTAKFEVEGNIMSLIDSTGYTTATTLASSFTFSSLFRNCTGLTSAENLVLPATTLANECYNAMFSACTSMTTAPELPTMTLADGCYHNMFKACSGLTTPPELPATALTDSCYSGMFSGCRSLTTAPELPATTLVNKCYQYMFQDCTSLTIAPELPATTLVSSCYYNMFGGCTNLNYIKCLATDISTTRCTADWVRNINTQGTFVKDANMSTWTTGINGIPKNWTVQDA